MLAASSFAAVETPLTIDQLLAQGWEIAGYASGYDNRTSLILFRHPGVNALVQCGILYDVTRAQRSRQLLRAAVRPRALLCVVSEGPENFRTQSRCRPEQKRSASVGALARYGV
jgi:hypothetical protein